MLKKKIPKSMRQFFAATVVILLLSSCQKEVAGDVASSTQDPSSGLSKVKTYVEDVTLANGNHFTDTFNLTYDNNGRLLSLVSTTPSSNKSTFQYNTDNTYTMNIYIGGILSIHELFFVNSIPYVDSTIQYEAISKDTTTEKYLYNSNKQLATLNQYHYSTSSGSTLLSTTNYTYDNVGNLIKEEQGSDITSYEYYLDLDNNLSTGLIYFQRSKNLVKTTTNASQMINHAYTFDNEKRIISEKDTYSNGNVVVLSFTYY